MKAVSYTHLDVYKRQYVLSLQIGEPVILNDIEMAEALERFKTYGKKP